MNILLVCGKHQYGDSSRGLGTEYSAFMNALLAIGHSVSHIESWNRNEYVSLNNLNRNILKKIIEIDPAIIIIVQMDYEVWIETLKIIKENTRTISICWTTDDSWKYKKHSRFIAKYYDIITTTYPEFIPKYLALGNVRPLQTQWAANAIDPNGIKPGMNCKYQVSFIGLAYPSRKRIIRKLAKNGVNVNCFGYGWPQGSIPENKINDTIRDSVIALNFSRGLYGGKKQIKARTFEVPGYGGFLLTEDSFGLNNYYDSNEISVFHNYNELLEKIKFYLNNIDIRDKLAQNAYERTVKQHTYVHRMNDIIKYAMKIDKKHMGNIPENHAEVIINPKCSLKAIKNISINTLSIFNSRKRSIAITRKLFLECSILLMGERAYSANGIPSIYF